MNFLEFATVQFSLWKVGEKANLNALERMRYERCVSQSNPPLSEENERRRLLFVRSHLSWTIKQWNQVLWTNESWFTGGQQTRLWDTRKVSSLNDNLSFPRTKSRLVMSFTRCAYILSLFEDSTDLLGIFPWERKNCGLVREQSWKIELGDILLVDFTKDNNCTRS